MNKKPGTNKILIVLFVLVGILILAVLFLGLKSKSSEDLPALVPVVKTIETQKVVINDMDAEIKCSAEGEKFLTNFRKGFYIEGFSQRNHYNNIVNKCYVLIIQPDSTNILFDSYENKRLATCKQEDPLIGHISWLGVDIFEDTPYISNQECNNFVNQKMEAK